MSIMSNIGLTFLFAEKKNDDEYALAVLTLSVHLFHFIINKSFIHRIYVQLTYPLLF